MKKYVRGSRMSWFSGIVLFVIFSVPSISQGAYPQTITTSTPFVNIPRPGYDPLWAKAFAHWDKRQNIKELKAAIGLFEELAEKYPAKPGPWVWLERSYYLGGIRDKSRREVYMRKSVEAAEKALSLKPGDETVLYWKFSAIVQTRPLNGAELEDIRKLGSKYGNLRELVVPEDDPMWKEAIKYWDARWSKSESLKAIEFFNKLDKLYPNRIEPKLWLARSNFWLHYITENNQEKVTWLLAAAKHGQRALAMEPRNPAACWWTAASLGQYGSHTSPVNIAKNALEMTRLLQVVAEEDPNYYYGGISQFIALSFARAGKVAQKATEILGFSQEMIERTVNFAAAYEPRYLRNHYALAELYIAQGKKEEARAKLEFIISADPKALPLMEPENLNTQKLARKLLEKIK